jgi:integrase
MTHSVLQFGTQIAIVVRDSSANNTNEVRDLKTLGDLLHIFGENPPRDFAALRTASTWLAVYLDKAADQITIDAVDETRDGFRQFLESRGFAENTIRKYVDSVRGLLKNAKELGWRPTAAVPEEWRGVLALTADRKCVEIAEYFARTRKMPRDVTIEDADLWAQNTIQQGHSYVWTNRKKIRFWRLLRDCGCTEQAPTCLFREKQFGVPFEQFPPGLKSEVLELLKWKTDEFVINRPKGGRIREITAKNLRVIIGRLLGFAVSVRGEEAISTLPQLVQKQIVSGYLEWSINRRRVKGASLQSAFGLLSAALRQHPSYASLDLGWFRPLLDSLPVERESESKKRKAEKYLEYEVLESIPAKIRAQRPEAAKRGIHHVALLVMDELLMKWLPVLPWRQRNIRECRISGPKPNLFKAKIPPFSDIDRPQWVKDEERNNPQAEFWQFRFGIDETKTGIDVQALLPRQLIGLLDEYLREFRPHLLHGPDPGTLFVNRAGKAMEPSQVLEVVATLTLQHGGRRVTPHLFRDIVAFAWLKAHPKDYLTLSKMLWHSNPNTTIQTYASRFNESSGVCAMDDWLEERAAKSK